MIGKERLHILQNKKLAEETYELKLTGKLVSDMTAPGQFLHVQIGEGWEHVLRRPLSIADVDHHVVTVIFKTIGEGTKFLAKKQPGETIDTLGPRGNGFPIKNVSGQHILLIGGGVGVPPLYYLGKKLVEQGNRVTSILGFQTKEAVFYERAFTTLGDCYIATDDGSYGSKGRVTDVIPALENPVDLYYSCGPKPMLKAVTKHMNVPGYVSLEERMGCGIGACFACVCETSDPMDERGYLKICQDGPVFAAEEVKL